MNKVVLLGNLSQDVELKYTGSGQQQLAIGQFTVAVNGYAKQGSTEKRVDFIRCVAFGKRAETISEYFFKGSKIALCGHIQVDSYTNKNGQKATRTVVIVDDFYFVTPKGEGQNGNNNNSNNKPNEYVGDAEEIDEEDLPF